MIRSTWRSWRVGSCPWLSMSVSQASEVARTVWSGRSNSDKCQRKRWLLRTTRPGEQLGDGASRLRCEPARPDDHGPMEQGSPPPHRRTAARSDDLLDLVSELIDGHTDTVQLITRDQRNELEWLAHCDYLRAPCSAWGARRSLTATSACQHHRLARHHGRAGHRCHSRLDGRPCPRARSRSCGSYAAGPAHRQALRRRARVELAPCMPPVRCRCG